MFIELAKENKLWLILLLISVIVLGVACFKKGPQGPKRKEEVRPEKYVVYHTIDRDVPLLATLTLFKDGGALIENIPIVAGRAQPKSGQSSAISVSDVLKEYVKDKKFTIGYKGQRYGAENTELS